ncbi:hypothetical protein PybrP1_005496, partial [[Pythium] brassicae (nom. inval.)]
MNALGLAAYGSSDDEEEDTQQSETKAAPLVDAVSEEDDEDEEDELEAALLRAGIPGEPPGRPDADARIRKYLAQSDARGNGTSFQQSLRAKRDVGNPYILEKVVAHFGIDELHSNFHPRVFDPHALPLHEFSDALTLAQKRKADARERRQLQQGPTRQLHTEADLALAVGLKLGAARLSGQQLGRELLEPARCSAAVPTRILYAEVVDVYKPMLPPEIFARFESNEKLFTQAILHAYAFPSAAYRLGDTRLFFRTGKIDLLDKLLTPSQASTEQLPAQIVHYVAKKRWISATATVVALNVFKRVYFACKYNRKATTIQCMVRQHLARKRLRKLRVLHRVSKIWARMAHQAQIMHAYHDLPDHKMVLLDKLLKKNYLPPPQRWLL